MVLGCQNVEDGWRVAVRFGAMMTAQVKVLGRRWVEMKVWVDVVDVIVGMGEWVVATGSIGWGSSDGGPRRLCRYLCSLISLEMMGVEVATLIL